MGQIGTVAPVGPTLRQARARAIGHCLSCNGSLRALVLAAARHPVTAPPMIAFMVPLQQSLGTTRVLRGRAGATPSGGRR